MDLKHELRQFTGTMNWYRHPLNKNVTYTDGVRFFAEEAGAHWFLDILATQPEILEQAKEFAAITLTVADTKGHLKVTDGNDKRVYQRKIDFTDCPPGTYDFYFYNDVIMLTSEY